jgi:hypothetical protein
MYLCPAAAVCMRLATVRGTLSKQTQMCSSPVHTFIRRGGEQHSGTGCGRSVLLNRLQHMVCSWLPLPSVSQCGSCVRVSVYCCDKTPRFMCCCCCAVLQGNSLSLGQASASSTTAYHSSRTRGQRYPLAAWKGSCWWTCTKMILEHRQSACVFQSGPSRSCRHPQQHNSRKALLS